MSEVPLAVPKIFNLGAIKPPGINAYTRKVQSISTNNTTFTENMNAQILIDTATPGAFLDPSQSLLQFDFTITNTNPYIDYVNFSACGVGAIIEEFRVVCQGTPIEEVLYYNKMFEMWMDLGGYAQEEFKMYMENSWRAPAIAGGNDLNFVKPPMVDREGVIMCPNNINMFGNTARVGQEQGTYLTSDALAISGVTSVKAPAYANLGINVGRKPATDSTAQNYIHVLQATPTLWAGSVAPGNIRTSTWTNRLDNTYVTWPSTIRPQRNHSSVSQQQVQDIGLKNYRLQDYLQFLSNVKNIPVGIAPAKSMIATDMDSTKKTDTASACSLYGEKVFSNWNFDSTSNHMSNASQKITFNVCLPIFSGLLGVWAEKAFPTMLIAPGTLYLQIKFAKADNVFQCAMDPCRRVIGTYRDYVPNWGLMSGYITDFAGQYIKDTKYEVAAANDNTTTWMCLTSAAANGTDFAWNGLLFQPGQWSAGINLIENALTDTTDGCPGAGMAEGSTTGTPKPQYVPMDTPWVSGGGWKNSKGVFKDGNGTVAPNLPMYVEEPFVCYGTYLPASTAQVRRTLCDAYNGKMSAALTNYTATNTPSYTVSNLYYVGQQIILPDEITSSIITMAVNGDISLNAHSCRIYLATTQQSATQSIIFPIKIASVNSLFFLFQNQQMNENSYYLGQTRNCPFSAFKWNADNEHFVGSDKPPTLTGVASLQPFQIQLRLGNDNIPLQPIQDVPSLVHELQRAVHAVSDMLYSIPTIGSLRQFRSTVNNSTPSNALANLAPNSSTEYLSLKSNDFLTPYVPIDALDDQTITDNILFKDYPSAVSDVTASSKITTLITSSTTKFTYLTAENRGKYVLNEFLPPVSKFLIGFDLDSFQNQTDVIRSGRFVGNGTVTLQMSNCIACSQSSVSTNLGNDVYNVYAVALHDIRFSIIAGGQILSYY